MKGLWVWAFRIIGLFLFNVEVMLFMVYFYILLKNKSSFLEENTQC